MLSDATHRLTEAIREYHNQPPVLPLSKFPKIQAGDIILSADRPELVGRRSVGRVLADFITGRYRQHASVALPDPEGLLRAVVTTSTGSEGRFPLGRTIAYPTLNKILSKKHLGRYFSNIRKSNSLPDLLTRVRSIFDSGNMPEPATMSSIVDELHTTIPVDELMRHSGYREVLRPKNPLSPQEVNKLVDNFRTTARYTTHGADNVVGAILNFLNIKPRTAIAPTNCAGGVAHLYHGIRDLGHSGTVLPADLALSNDFSSIGKMYRRIPVQSPGKAFMGDLGRIGVRGLFGGTIGAAGLYGANRLLIGGRMPGPQTTTAG
jgi:hypothetical protein